MEWLSQNWIVLAFAVGMVLMMRRGGAGGCCGSIHAGHGTPPAVDPGPGQNAAEKAADGTPRAADATARRTDDGSGACCGGGKDAGHGGAGCCGAGEHAHHGSGAGQDTTGPHACSGGHGRHAPARAAGEQAQEPAQRP